MQRLNKSVYAEENLKILLNVRGRVIAFQVMNISYCHEYAKL